MATLLVTDMPVSQQQTGPNEFPLAGLFQLLTTRPAWSTDRPSPQEPERGGPTDISGVVATERTSANGGNGRAPGKGIGELGEYTRLKTPQPGRSTTGAELRGFDEATSRRLDSGGTKTSDLYQNADGTVTRSISTQPVNYRAPDGSWKPIDTNLVRDGDRLRAAASGVPVSLAGGQVQGFAAANAGRSQPASELGDLAVITLPGGEEFSFSLQDARAVTPVASGPTVKYPSILPDVDVELTAFYGGVKETLVLHSKDAPNSWVFPLRLKGLRAVVASDGSVELLDGKGAVAARIPHGYMQDSHFQEGEGEFVKSSAVTYELVDGGRALKVTADRAWLDDPARVYPVSIDPTTTVSTNGDVYIDPNPSTGVASQDGDSIAVGWDGDLVGSPLKNDIKVSYVAFGDFKSATTEHPNLTGMRISSATLNLFHTWTPSSKCNSHLPFSVHSVNGSWSVSGLDEASTGPSVSPAIGSLTVQNNYPACTNTSGDRSVGNWVAANLTDLRIFNAWSQGVLPNYGLALTASGSDHGAFKRFTSENYGGTCKTRACQPYLRVTYAPDSKPQLNDAFPANGYASPTLTPELLADASDAEGDPLTYRFRVYSSSGTQIADSNSTSARSWTVPANLLKWSESYIWTVVASDGVVATDTKVNVLTPTPPQPLITSKLSQNGGKGIEPSIGNYTTTAVDADIATVGPALKVERHYNSRDSRPRAFGAGWSSLLDSRVTFGPSDANGFMWMTVTYPDGQDVVFGRRADGSYAPPSGRFATLRDISSPGVFMFELVEKNGLKFTFTNRPSIMFSFLEPRLLAIEDQHGRALELRYTKGIHHVDPILMTSLQVMNYQYDASGTRVASWPGRKLTFAYSGTRVASVSTEPATPGDSSTVSTWSYTYASGKLVKVCPPTSATACAQYEYGTNWLYPTAAHDAAPHTYLRFDDPAGSLAAVSEPTDSDESAAGTYENVTLGQTGPTGSLATAAGFDGATSWVTLSEKAALKSGYQTVSMWFKGTSGVLFSASAASLPGTTAANYNPVLYVGTDGLLRGQVWTGTMAPITTTTSVNDGNWHHVALSVSGATQTLYVDGVQVGDPLSGAVMPFGQKNFYVGAGYWVNWPGTAGTNSGYFNGTISDFAFYTKPLTVDQVMALRNSGTAPSTPLVRAIRPMGGVDAQITYDSSGVVSELTDENGGNWKVSPAVITGSDNVYASSVLSGAPADYWRLGETGSPQIAKNEINGSDATFNLVDLGQEGPFATTTSGKFNGTSSYLKLPTSDVPKGGPESISLWFKAETGTYGVLFSYQSAPVTDTAAASFVPALYVGNDGKLRAQLWTGGGQIITSAGKVDDGSWHHAVLSSSKTSQTLYLDGAAAGTTVKNRVDFGATHAYVGAGKWLNWPATTGTVSYFPGWIAEVAYYKSELSSGDIAAQFAAYQKSAGAPTRTVAVEDPSLHSTVYRYDSVNGRRLVERVDPLGGKTVYGYDSGGFLRSVTDPNGNMTVTGHDVRGNTVSQTTCQDRSTNKCSTSYYTFYPDATTKVLTPDPRNDLPLTIRDGRSSSATDNTYVTTMVYDAKGNRTEVIDALGRKVTSAFTDGTGGVPAGLLKQANLPNGAQILTNYTSFGDISDTTDAAGLRTEFTYDGHGRVASKKVFGPETLVTTYKRDKLDRLIEQTDPPSRNEITGNNHTKVTTTKLDDDGRVIEVKETDTTGGDLARVTTMNFGTHRLLTSITDPAGHTQQFEYDSSGRISKQIAADGVATVYSYDDAGRHIKTQLVGTPESATAPNTDIESRQYDIAGRLAAITDAQGYRNEYAYTDNGLVASIVRRDPAPGAESSYVVESNVYDFAGNLTRKVTNNGATTTDYTVDQLSRVTEALLDPAGLKRKKTFTYGANNMVTSTTLSDPLGIQTADYGYDSAGRMTSQSIRMPSGTGGPDGWWQLNETSGTTAADSSAMARNGTTSGSVSWSDGAASFSGTSSIAVAGPVLSTTTSYTVAVWVKLTDNAAYRSALSIDGQYNSAFFLGYEKTVNKWRIAGCTSDIASPTCSNAVSTGVPQLNVWTHLVGVYNKAAGTLKLYVNGQPQSSITYTAWQANGNLMIGRAKYRGGHVDQWTGSIDNVQAYQRVLTDTEIAALHGGGRSASALSNQAITTSLARDSQGRVTQQTDPNGNVTRYFYDTAGRLVRSELPTVTAEEFGAAPVSAIPEERAGYNTFGELVDTKDPKGRIVHHARDASGWVTETKLPVDAGMEPKYTTQYDAVGRIKVTKDPLLNATSYDYDRMGRLKQSTAADSGISSFGYDMLGNLTSATDPTGAMTEATYDPLGRQTTLKQATFTTNLTYSAFGQPDRVVSPKGVTAEFGYNAAGETTWEKSPAGHFTDYRYDYAGQPTWVFPPIGAAEKVEYDAAGRPQVHRLYTPGPGRAGTPGAQIDSESVLYDSNSNVLSKTDFRGNTTTFSYDPRGLLTSQAEPESITTSFGYDLSGAPTRFTDGRGNKFWTTYNGWGLEKSRIEPATATYPESEFTTAYDIAGRPLTQTLPGNVTLSYTTDSMGRVERIAGSGAEAPTTDRTFAYDLAGRVRELSGSGGVNTLTYDSRGLMLSATGPSGNSSFTYNEDGQMATRVDAAGTTSYDYTNGQLSQVTNTGTGVDAAVAYNPLGQVDAITYGGTGNLRRFSYDNRHRLFNDELKTPGGTSIAKIGYGWDDNGNETSKTTVGFGASAANAYTYDNANRLKSWTSGSTTVNYAYDKSGNRTSANGKTFTYNERNQLTASSDGTTYAYTARGSRSSQTTGSVTLNTVSDAFDQVVKQYHSPTAYSEYNYDGLGRAIKAGFSYTGVENDLAADGTATYTRDPAGGLLGVKQGGASVLAWTDLHSDVVGQFTATGTSLSASTVYDPLGKVQTTSGMVGNLGYQSEWTDLQTGRLNMHSRWYNPDTGQFDSRDTWSNSATPDSGDANRYSYTNQNPLTRVDPSGHLYDSHDRKDQFDYCNQTAATVQQCAASHNKGETGNPAIDCGKNSAKCFVDGFFEAFDVIDMIGGLIEFVGALTDLGQAWTDIKEGWEELKAQAASWGDKLRGLGFWSPLATALGWICVASGACGAINDCFGDGQGSCAYHAGLALSSAAIAAVTGGTKIFADRLKSLARDLFNRKNTKNDDSEGKKDDDNGSGGPAAPPTPTKATDYNRPPDERDWDDPKPKKEPTDPDNTGGDNGDSGDRDDFGPAICETQWHSFDPATHVLMADGSAKAIGDIELGERVVATDPVTGETSPQEVTALHVNLDEDLTNVTIGEGEGDRSTRGPTATAVTLETTHHHPFWDATTRSWVDAAELVPGQSTVVGPDGQTHAVEAVDTFVGAELMRDLTVANVHTYYVIAGESPVLVHNVNADECPILGLILPPNATASIVTPKTVFRGDRRSPDAIVNAGGFTSLGTNLDLMKYVINNGLDSAWVSTSSKENRAAAFPWGNGARWVYEIRNPGAGVDVNRTFGLWFRLFNDRARELEVVFPHIALSNIAGARLWNVGQPTSEVWENPEFLQ